MTKILTPPAEFKQPTWKGSRDEYFAAEGQYIDKVIEWAKANSKDPYAGELVRFQVADGYAQYVVLSLRPVKVIHLPLGDAYQFPYMNRLTASDIKKRIEDGRWHGVLRRLAEKHKHESDATQKASN